jgi:hypothetical protein
MSPTMGKQGTSATRLRRARGSHKPKASPPVVLPSPAMPMAVARLFVEQRCQCDGVLTLHHWRGTWWEWRRSHWCEMENDAARSLLYTFTENARYRDADGNMVPWAPNRKKIGDLLEALAAITILATDIDQPTWLDGRSTGTIVAVANGLLEVETRHLLPRLVLSCASGASSIPTPTSRSMTSMTITRTIARNASTRNSPRPISAAICEPPARPSASNGRAMGVSVITFMRASGCAYRKTRRQKPSRSFP